MDLLVNVVKIIRTTITTQNVGVVRNNFLGYTYHKAKFSTGKVKKRTENKAPVRHFKCEQNNRTKLLAKRNHNIEGLSRKKRFVEPLKILKDEVANLKHSGISKDKHVTEEKSTDIGHSVIEVFKDDNLKQIMQYKFLKKNYLPYMTVTPISNKLLPTYQLERMIANGLKKGKVPVTNLKNELMPINDDIKKLISLSHYNKKEFLEKKPMYNWEHPPPHRACEISTPKTMHRPNVRNQHELLEEYNRNKTVRNKPSPELMPLNSYKINKESKKQQGGKTVVWKDLKRKRPSETEEKLEDPDTSLPPIKYRVDSAVNYLKNTHASYQRKRFTASNPEQVRYYYHRTNAVF